MRFSRIELHTAGSLRATLNLSELRHKTPYMIRAMSGLDITEVKSRFYGFSHLVGADGFRQPFFEPVLPHRDIAVRVGYRPNYLNYGSRSTLRDEFYRLLGSTRSNNVELHFFDGARAAMYIKGTLTKLEPSLFSEESEVILTFHCDDPIFRGPTNIVVASPEQVLTEGTIRTFSVHDPQSTFQHGLKFDLTFPVAVDRVEVVTDQIDNKSQVVIDVSSGWVSNTGVRTTLAIGNILTVDTRDKLPVLTVNYGGNVANLVDKVTLGSVWPAVYYGENIFVVKAKSGASYVTPPTVSNVVWVPHYAGV